MKRRNKTAMLLALVLIAQISFAQTNKEKAHEKAQQAIKLEDEGKYVDALKLLNEAQKLDPEDYNYPYEIGYTYYLQKDYTKALEVYKKVVTYKNVTDQCFQMLGSVYDYLGDSLNAFKAYDEGLKLFPQSGKLYLEKGNVCWGKKNYN